MHVNGLSGGRFEMADDASEAARLVAQVRSFGWHAEKHAINLRDHKIDFEDVKGIFDGPTFIRRSDRHGEIRYQVFGYVQEREVAVACAFRGEVCWLISARRARRDERRKYYDRFAG
jgi:uncharacterized DUF497 family protein